MCVSMYVCISHTLSFFFFCLFILFYPCLSFYLPVFLEREKGGMELGKWGGGEDLGDKGNCDQNI